jgi:CheY-like chemotaxis protein
MSSGNRYVIVAEDDPEMRALVAESLRRDGHHVVEVTDGAGLLGRIGRQYRRVEPAPHIDLIVSDVRMPSMTGLEILRGLRAAGCRTHVILMSAFCDVDLRRQASELDAILLSKPFGMKELRETAARLLDELLPVA